MNIYAIKPGVSEVKTDGAALPSEEGGERGSAWEGRVLGLDYGSQTLGVAVSDPSRQIAQGLEIIRRKEENHLRSTYRRIEEIISAYAITEIVLGLPLCMDDSVGDRAEKTLAFGRALAARVQRPVHMMDERLTSVEAEESMRLAGIRRSEYKKYVDQIAAALILQDWLNQNRPSSGRGTE